MKKIIYIAFVLLIISCKKDYEYIDMELKDCEKENIYYLTINNSTEYTYEIKGKGQTFYTYIQPYESKKRMKVSTSIKTFVFSYSNDYSGGSHSFTGTVSGRQCEECNFNITDSNVPECLKKKIFYVTIKNNQSDTYYIYDKDGNKLSSVEPNKTCTITLSATKTHKLKLQQANGYIFFPTIYNKEVSGNSCDEKNISIP